jgi:hypothetical protein
MLVQQAKGFVVLRSANALLGIHRSGPRGDVTRRVAIPSEAELLAIAQALRNTTNLS